MVRGYSRSTQTDALRMRRKVARSKVSIIETGPFMDTYFGWEHVETGQSRKCEEEDETDEHILLVDCLV